MKTSIFLKLVGSIVCWLICFTIYSSSLDSMPGIELHDVYIDRDVSSLSLVSFNVWALPVWLPRSKQSRRYKVIPEQLLGLNADVLCLQEAFSKKLRKKLLEEVEPHYFSGSDNSCNQSIMGPIVKDCRGGLVTYSRYPIVYEVFYRFPKGDQMRWEERIGEKGFLFSVIESPNGLINIVNTHLYAGHKSNDEANRLGQIIYMDSMLTMLEANYPHPTFLLGDINITHPCVAESQSEKSSSVYEYIVGEMGFTDTAGSYASVDITFDEINNPYAHSNDGNQKLDYCFYKIPLNTSVSLQSTEVLLQGQEAISDHYGWLSVFDLSVHSEPNQGELVAIGAYSE